MDRFRVALIPLFILLIASVAHASDKFMKMEVVISHKVDESSTTTQNAKTQHKVLEETRDRLVKRFDAARIKHSVIELTPNDSIMVKVKPRYARGWYTALIASEGRLAVRELRPGAVAWPQLTSLLGDKIEIRSEIDSAGDTYLWSADPARLSEIARRVHLPGLEVVVAPEPELGWRTYTAATTLASNADLADVRRQISPVGAPYITLVMSSSIVERLAASQPSKVQRWGVILDGEVLGLVPTSALRTRSIELTAPEQSGTRDAQRAWAAQVTGRLAATLSLPIAVLEE